MDRRIIVTNVLLSRATIPSNGWDLMPGASQLFNCSLDSSCNNMLYADKLFNHGLYVDILLMELLIYALCLLFFKIFLTLFVLLIGDEERMPGETYREQQIRHRRVDQDIMHSLRNIARSILFIIIIPLLFQPN